MPRSLSFPAPLTASDYKKAGTLPRCRSNHPELLPSLRRRSNPHLPHGKRRHAACLNYPAGNQSAGHARCRQGRDADVFGGIGGVLVRLGHSGPVSRVRAVPTGSAGGSSPCTASVTSRCPSLAAAPGATSWHKAAGFRAAAGRTVARPAGMHARTIRCRTCQPLP
jgi:hypothetical protein